MSRSRLASASSSWMVSATPFGAPQRRQVHKTAALMAIRGGGHNNDNRPLRSNAVSSESTTTMSAANNNKSIPHVIHSSSNNNLVIPNSLLAARRSLSSTTTESNGKKQNNNENKDPDLTFETTPLGRNGRHLLQGLDVHQVHSSTDGHPLSVYGIQSANNDEYRHRKPILLLHGRTWSSVPVYHLLGGTDAHVSRSLMEALLEEGLQPYCMDFRGFGGTHKDATGYVEPLQCVSDVNDVLRWIARQQHPQVPADQVTLLGWSQGALVAQLVAQMQSESDDHHHPHADIDDDNTENSPNSNNEKNRCRLFGKLILYGSIYDPLVRYPREPLYRLGGDSNSTNNDDANYIENTFDMALEDFTIQGTIAPEPAQKFAQAALLSDPIKAAWKHLYQFNNCDPARIRAVKCLVVAGDQDPYAPLRVQEDLFCNLGRGCDRTWSILSDCDHAVHLLEHKRERLIHLVARFVQDA